MGDAKKDEWLRSEFAKVGDETQITSRILSVLLTCGSVMTAPHDFAADGLKDTKCTQEVWMECRRRYITQAKKVKKANDLNYNWIPKTAKKGLFLQDSRDDENTREEL